MNRDVVLHIVKCDTCHVRKMKRKRVPLQDMPIAEAPFDTIGTDTCGPFPETESGNNNIVKCET